MLNNIPDELKKLNQWVCVDMSIDPVTGLPRKWPIFAREQRKASPTDPSTWCSYNEAVSYLDNTVLTHIGFVLSKTDDYCIIDLDNKISKPLSNDEINVHNKILDAFDTYIERSASGRGFHIVVKASIEMGRRRGNVEIYSQDRYMIFTGNIVKNRPITECQDLVNHLIREMTVESDNDKNVQLTQIDSNVPDYKIVEKASDATNGDKFDKLCNGDWQNDYPSQSEADFALMSMFCFYSKDNEQCRRLFRKTALGKRDKAKRDSYLNYAISKIRGNTIPSVDFAELMNKANNVHLLEQEENANKIEYKINANLDVKSLEPLQGLLGEISQYFYSTSIRPVKEISILAALALISGIAGRSYNISGSGLNQYLILLAKTGSGKEGAAKAIEHLITATRPLIPTIDQFIGPAAFSSGQALIKTLDNKPCFISILGEFGLTLQQISDSRATSSEKMFKKVLLDLYGKSGHSSTLRASVYSDSDKNTNAIRSPNVTILGESTPETFFESLDQSHIAEGLIPRFSIIEYKGDRPNRNKNSNHPPSNDLVQKFASFVAISLNLQSKNACVPINISDDAILMLDEFDTISDRLINNAKNDVEMQLWNRAHLKALKLAGILAVGNNPLHPIIDTQCAKWAIDFVKLDISTVISRFSDGNVGLGDNKQLFDMKQVIIQYPGLSKDSIKNYKINEKLHQSGIIQLSYLSRRCSSMAAFRKDRTGSRRAIVETIKFLLEQGSIVEIPLTQLEQTFGVRARCFGIADIGL